VTVSTADVRRLLTETFTDQEFEAFCFDYFPQVQTDFSAGMSKGERIQSLLEYCERRNAGSDLVELLRAVRPAELALYLDGVSEPLHGRVAPLPGSVPGSGLVSVDSALLDQLIRNHRHAIRYHSVFAVGILLLGLALVAGAYLVFGHLLVSTVKQLAALGGVFICSLSLLQFKEVVSRKEKASIFEAIQANLNDLQERQVTLDFATNRRIEGLLWKAVEETALR
jgi:hypothetical protein